MLKFLLTVTVFQQLLLQTECLFSGENCFAEGRRGVCLLLYECKSISNEIRSMGKPMTPYMRNKLQNLTCGYDHLDPLICCTSLQPFGSDSDRFQDVTSSVFSHSGETINFVGGEEHQHNSNNLDTFTRRTLVGNGDGPKAVDGHPNLGLLPKSCGTIESDRIIGGNRTSLFEMPWMVLLSYTTNRGVKLSCGGTIINRWYILTAAHCVTSLSRMRLDGVILGEYDIRYDPDCEISDGRERCAPSVINATIDKVIAHPGYTREALADDIALIRLSQPADFSLDSQQPICLPITRELQSLSLAALNGVVAGWGVTEDGLQSPVLLSVELPIVSSNACQNFYNGSVHLTQKQLCAGGVKDKDSCGGDSGGPLMYPGQYGTNGLRYIQHGIVSFGSKRCGISGFPGVYTNVAYYMDWILDNIHS